MASRWPTTAWKSTCEAGVNPSNLQPPPWSRSEFEVHLREKGKAYHIHHPMNVLLNGGGASREQIQGWLANRFYYQIAIPVKDPAILSNCPVREVRREWIGRILDHDGFKIGSV